MAMLRKIGTNQLSEYYQYSREQELHSRLISFLNQAAISILKEVFAMSETDYNARLYEKMKAEQDKYRDWLARQEPSEILNHTYEYTMREDIVMCMEELELEPEKARALLRSPCPLSDVYKEFRDRETEHMDTIRDSIETEADKNLQRQEKKQQRESR